MLELINGIPGIRWNQGVGMYQYQNLPQNFWVLSFGFWYSFGYWVLGFGSVLGLGILGFGSALGLGVLGFGFGFGDLGFVRPWIMMIIFTKKSSTVC